MKTKILTPVKERYYAADEFLNIVKTKRDNIETTRFIPPRLGTSGFGKFKVVFKHADLKKPCGKMNQKRFPKNNITK